MLLAWVSGRKDIMECAISSVSGGWVSTCSGVVEGAFSSSAASAMYDLSFIIWVGFGILIFLSAVGIGLWVYRR